MTDLDVLLNEYMPNEQAATVTYKGWRSKFPTEAAAWDKYLTAISAGITPTVPTLTTRYGKKLLAAAKMAVTETTPTPTPEPPSSSTGLFTAGRRLTTHWAGASSSIPDQATADAIKATHAYLCFVYGGQMNGYANQLRTAGVKLLRYTNPGFTARADLPASWYWRLPDGRRVYDSGQNLGTGRYWWLMRPDSTETAAISAFGEYGDYKPAAPIVCAGFADYLAQAFLQQKAYDAKNFATTFDGVWFDDVAGNPNSRALRAEGDPSTDITIVLSESAWYGMTGSAINLVAAKTGSSRIANTLMGAGCYFNGCGGTWPDGAPLAMKAWYGLDPNHTLPTIDGGMAEDWYHGLLGTEAQFVSSVQMVSSVPKPTVFVVRPATGITRDYSWAAFLLGYQANAIFWYANGDLEMANAAYTRDLGSSLEAFHKDADGWYRRRFEKATVSVNFTSKAGLVA